MAAELLHTACGRDAAWPKQLGTLQLWLLALCVVLLNWVCMLIGM